MYVYLETQSNLWTVGFFTPDGSWEPEKDCGSAEEAAERVAWLNGSQGADFGTCLNVLSELVRLEDYRGRHGKTTYYNSTQPKLWDRAKDIVRKYAERFL